MRCDMEELKEEKTDMNVDMRNTTAIQVFKKTHIEGRHKVKLRANYSY